MGLSYGYDIRMHTEEGQLYFALSRSVSIQKAYHEARAILDEFVTGKVVQRRKIEKVCVRVRA